MTKLPSITKENFEEMSSTIADSILSIIPPTSTKEELLLCLSALGEVMCRIIHNTTTPKDQLSIVMLACIADLSANLFHTLD